MEMDQYFVDEEEGSSANFDCNICLDAVQEPIVTFCGHLFCWPCIYKWTYPRNTSNQEDEDQKKHQRCPVCKAEVSHTTLVPIYGRGQTSKNAKKKSPDQLGMVIPRRPLGPVHGLDARRSRVNPRPEAEIRLNHPHQAHLYSMPDPVTGVLYEMVYERLFGNSLPGHSYGHTSPRVRRRVMQTDESLSRIYFFLICCMVMCLLLF